MPAPRWPEEVRQTTRELKVGVAEARRVGLRSWKSRKCARWLVPNWVSKPSAVLPSGGAMTPALLMRMFRVLLFFLKFSAAERTLSRELRSIIKSSTCPGFRTSDRAACPLAASRTPRKSLAPVELSALAVSIPMPEEQPVMRKTLSVSLPCKPSSLMMSRAVGRASPGPLGFW